MSFEEYVSVLKRKIKAQNNVLFVCIGTSDILWDSIGPLVGSFLKERINNRYVIGDMNNNICSKYDLLIYNSIIRDKFIVAIDVALNNGLKNDIYVTSNAISMGIAFNNNKGSIGDLSIKAGISNWQSITHSEVSDIAEFIAKGILRLII